MSGFTGSTKTLDSTPSDIRGPRKQLSGFISQQGFDPLMTGAPDITPYLEMFEQQNAINNARAKEQAGNLTGSGFANTYGAAVARANVEQGGFLANLLEQSRQANANRYAGIINSFLNQGVGPAQTVYQPGFLDSVMGAGAGLASGGFFNPLLGAQRTPSQRGNLTQSGGR